MSIAAMELTTTKKYNVKGLNISFFFVCWLAFFPSFFECPAFKAKNCGNKHNNKKKQDIGWKKMTRLIFQLSDRLCLVQGWGS